MNTQKRVRQKTDSPEAIGDQFTGNNAAQIAVKFTRAEIELLTALASDQLFRREFIDPRLPGYRPNTEEVAMGKLLVARLRLLLDSRAAKSNQPGGMTS